MSCMYFLCMMPSSDPRPCGVQSYLISLFLDCPTGMNLHCPDAQAVAAVEAAIREGVITWHAFPHNAQVHAGRG